MEVVEQPTLQKLIGKTVAMRIPHMKEEGPVMATVHAIEISGVWIECEEYTQDVLDELGVQANELIKIPVLFVPYSQIACIMEFLDLPIARLI